MIKKRMGLLVFSSLLVLLAATISNAQVDTFWTGNGVYGLFSDINNWTNGVPNGNSDVFIDGGNSFNSIVNMDVDASINNLDISPGDAFNIHNGLMLTVSGIAMENNGQFNVNGGAIEIAGSNVSLFGGATNEVVLNGGVIVGASATSGLTNHSNIRGFGVIGNVVLNNAGEIAANHSGGSLQIIMDADFTNTGVLKATGAGMLDITANGGSAVPITLNNSGGIIQADAGTIVSIRTGVTVEGGTLQADGIIQAVGNDINFKSIINNNALSISNGSTAGFSGTINNDGRIVINSSGSTTTFDSLDANLTGQGTVELVGNNAVITSSVVSAQPHDFLTTDNTIIGGGAIRISQFKNTGTIASTGVGNILNIESAAVNNSGTIESRAESTLVFVSSATDALGNPDYMHVNNADGLIYAQDNSTLRLGLSSINGGMLRTTGSGIIETGATILDGVTIEGFIKSGIGTARLRNEISLNPNGILESDPGGSGQGGSLFVEGNVSLNGTGEVWLNNGGGLEDFSPQLFSSTINRTIIRNSSGEGTIKTIEFRNYGEVISEGSGSLLTFDLDGVGNSQNPSLINSAAFTAKNGGVISILNQAGGFTDYSAGTLSGGGYAAINGGVIRADVFDITTNRAGILLRGIGAKFTTNSPVPVNALANFSLNEAIAGFSIENGATLTTSAASLTNRGLFIVDEDSTLSVGSGTGEFDQETGTVTINGRLNVINFDLNGGRLSGDGGEIGGSVVHTGGFLSPGRLHGPLLTTGTLNILGNYSQFAGGTLEIELGSLTDFDLLDNITATSLAGTLDIRLLDGYMPKVGDEFIILKTGTLSGSFANVINPGSYKFNVGYFDTQGFVKLTVASVPEPSSGFVMLMGLTFVAVKRRRSSTNSRGA